MSSIFLSRKKLSAEESFAILSNYYSNFLNSFTRQSQLLKESLFPCRGKKELIKLSGFF